MKFNRIFTTWMMFFSSVAYATEPAVYVVKAGDSLSTIAQSQVGSPVYPKNNGSLYKLISMNPGITRSSVIYPGQALIVGQNPLQTTQASKGETPKEQEQPSAQEQKEVEEIPHKLVLEASYGMTTLSATDPSSIQSADLFTSHDVGINAGWKQEWSAKFSTTVFGSLRDVDFQASTSSTKSLSSTHKTMTGLGIKAEQSVSDRLQIHYSLGYQGELFMYGLSTSAVVVDSVPVPKAALGVSYKALEIGKTSLGFHAQGASLMSTSTDGYLVSSGSLYSVGGYIRRKYRTDSSVRLGLSYQDRAQNTSVLNMHEKSVLGTLTFELPLFEGGEKK